MKKTLRKGAKRQTAGVSSLITAISNPTPKPNVAYNEKGALSYATTTSAVLDWFSSGGAMRKEPQAQIESVFAKAFNEDRLLATKVAFFHRDIRGGNGQRRAFRAVLQWLAHNNPQVVIRNLANVPEYGRWDDLFCLIDTPLRSQVMALVEAQLKSDLRDLKKGESVSLLGKWMPSENTSSANTRRLAHFVRSQLNLSPKKYRKMLSALRRKIEVVEREMCAQNWSGINYSHVPSKALLRYRKKFALHDPVGFSKWKGNAFAGKAKVNAATLYPYDIIHKVMNGEWDETLELQWRNLPNLLEGEVHNALVVCDVSGSMEQWNYPSNVKVPWTTVRPLDIAISLAMYFAERCEGPFKNHFITFSGSPTLQKVQGNSILEKAQHLNRSQWTQNTDVQRVFEMILEKAVLNRIPEKDMPDAIYIVSDLQFDACRYNERNLDAIKAKYQRAGYKMPLLVFWQVRYNSDKVALKNEKGVVLTSGFSPNAIKGVLKLEEPRNVTPMELMLATINTPRYEAVTV